MDDLQHLYSQLDLNAVRLREAVKSGDTQLAAHLAGVSRKMYDPAAPVPAAPMKPQTGGNTDVGLS